MSTEPRRILDVIGEMIEAKAPKSPGRWLHETAGRIPRATPAPSVGWCWVPADETPKAAGEEELPTLRAALSGQPGGHINRVVDCALRPVRRPTRVRTLSQSTASVIGGSVGKVSRAGSWPSSTTAL